MEGERYAFEENVNWNGRLHVKPSFCVVHARIVVTPQTELIIGRVVRKNM